MAAKKAKKTLVTPVSPEEAIEHRVDEMMSVNKTESTATMPVTSPIASAPELGEITIPGVENIAEEKPPVTETIPPAEPDDDPSIDPLVDDIVAKESDELLAHRDEAAAAVTHEKPVRGTGNRNIFKAWWHSKFARYGTVLVLVAGLCALGAYPDTRYYTLNAVGVRSGASLIIVDNATQLPLKNVSVELGSRKAKTNTDGLVKLSQLELGTQSLTISQTGFATVTQTVTLGLGSNPLGDFKLQAVGMQYRITLLDYLSGKPVTDAEINSDESNAKADTKGKITLTVDHDEAAKREATVSAQGYRDEKLTLQPGPGQNQNIRMVPSGKHVYVSKQSGKFDLYKTDIDGKDKQVLLAGTGNEDTDIAIAQSDDGRQAALVSKRDSLKNQDGFTLQSLTLVNVEKGTTLSLEHSEHIQLIDWIGDRIVYVKIKAGSSGGSPDRYQLVSYDYTSNSRLQLASANSFNHVISAGGILYFAASNNYQNGVSQFVRIRPDNTGKQVILDKTDVWDVIRTSYNSLSLTTNQQTTYAYMLGDNDAKTSGTQQGRDADKFFLDDEDGKRALWADSRDGKGVLLVNNPDTGKDDVITSQSGLSSPFRWLSPRVAVYRSVKPGETADYAVSLDGGEPKKIADVTATTGPSARGY